MTIPVKYSDREFEECFAQDALLVKKGGYEFSEHEKITAFRCTDDITVFGVERVGNKVQSIMAWRFSNANESIVDMQLKFKELVTPEANCKFYIVGGTENTTKGYGCLLFRIQDAINGYFTQPKIPIVRENKCLDHKCTYVTVKLEMSGNIMDCYHN